MVTLVLAAALISWAPEPTNLVGLWESAAPRNGIGNTLEFRADGEFVEAPAFMVDLYYRVVGDRLIVGEKPLKTDADAGEASRVRIEGNEFVQTGPDGSVVRKQRLGRPAEGKPAIVGIWRYRHYTKAIAFERYTDDGRVLFRAPMVSLVGHYFLKADELLLSQPNRPDVKMTVDIRGDDLRLRGSDGRTTDYRRARDGAWYDIEHIEKQQ